MCSRAGELQQGIVTHPRSSNPEHMKENLAASTLTLTAKEMKEISTGLAVPDCSKEKKFKCPEGSAQPIGGCCKICPLTADIP